MDVATIVKAIGLTSAGLFAGYTWALSDASIPSILLAQDDKTIAAQWRLVYLKGVYISRPLCIINFVTFSYLAYHSNTPLGCLYIPAALLTASGVPYALTVLRRTNGALSVRADKLAGPGNGAIALTYAFYDRRASEREETWGTVELARRWQWHNGVRTWILILGVLLGAVGVGLDGS